jgi:hypothetical protein
MCHYFYIIPVSRKPGTLWVSLQCWDEANGAARMRCTFGLGAATISSENANTFAISVGLLYTKPMRKTYKYRIYLTNGQKRILKIQLKRVLSMATSK